MNVLSTELAMSSGGFTKLADRIQAAGLIARVPSAVDRRVVFAELTDYGTEMAQRGADIADEHVRARLVDQFTEAELADLSRRIGASASIPEPSAEVVEAVEVVDTGSQSELTVGATRAEQARQSLLRRHA